jgi:hypothetical protein
MHVSTRFIVLCLALLTCAACAPDLGQPKAKSTTWVMNMTTPIKVAQTAVF